MSDQSHHFGRVATFRVKPALTCTNVDESDITDEGDEAELTDEPGGTTTDPPTPGESDIPPLRATLSPSLNVCGAAAKTVYGGVCVVGGGGPPLYWLSCWT